MVQIPKWQVILAAVVVVLGSACASPNVINADVTEKDRGRLPSQESDLGLDLRGGSYLLIEVGKADVTEEDRGRLPSQKSDLGLDLRGGSYLMMEIDLEKALAERLETISAGIAAPLRQARIKHNAGVQDGKIFIELHDPGEMERARELIRNHVQNYVVSEDGSRIEIDVPEERMGEIRTSIINEIQTSVMNEFFRNEGAQTPPESNR